MTFKKQHCEKNVREIQKGKIKNPHNLKKIKEPLLSCRYWPLMVKLLWKGNHHDNTGNINNTKTTRDFYNIK